MRARRVPARWRRGDRLGADAGRRFGTAGDVNAPTLMAFIPPNWKVGRRHILRLYHQACGEDYVAHNSLRAFHGSPQARGKNRGWKTMPQYGCIVQPTMIQYSTSHNPRR